MYFYPHFIFAQLAIHGLFVFFSNIFVTRNISFSEQVCRGTDSLGRQNIWARQVLSCIIPIVIACTIIITFHVFIRQISGKFKKFDTLTRMWHLPSITVPPERKSNDLMEDVDTTESDKNWLYSENFTCT